MIERLNPPELLPPEGYVHVSVAEGRVVNVACETAMDREGRLVADDLAGQTAAALRNVSTALGAVDASFEDVVACTILVADWAPEKQAELVEGVMRVAGEIGAPAAATTLIPVPRLFADGVLVEISAQAVVR